MRQWFGVSANAVLNMRWTQFINHANYKIIDSNVIDWAKVTNIHTPPSAKCYSPPPWRACAVQRQFHDQEWWAIESHSWHRCKWYTNQHCVGSGGKTVSRPLLHCCSLTKAQSSMPLGAIAVVSDTLFSEPYVMRVFSFYFSQLIAKERPDEHCIMAFR